MKMHYPTNPPTPGSQLPCPVASLLQMLFSALMVTLSLILLLIFCIRTQEARCTFFNPLYANLISFSLFCSAIARPATILQTIESYYFDPRYCTAYVFMLELETMGLPLAVLMLIVERVVYFSCLPLPAPLESYKQRLSVAWKILLVALPWIGGVLLTFVKTFGLLRPIVPFGDITLGLNDTDRYYYSCHLEGRSQKADSAGEGLLFSFRSGIPFVYLCVAVVVMLVYWCKAYSVVNPSSKWEDEVDSSKKNEGGVELLLQPRNSYDETNNSVFPIKEDKNQNLPSQDEETTETHEPRPRTQEPEPADKTNATVFIVILLALTCVCVSVGGSIMVKYYGWLYETSQWLYFSLEFTAVFLAYCCIPEVRRTLCCCRVIYGDQDRREQEFKLGEMGNLSTLVNRSPTSERSNDSRRILSN